jgi:hypothetical protein
MKRPWAIALVFIVGLAIGGAVVWKVADGDSNGGKTNLSAKNGSTSNSSSSADELFDRLARGADAKYHVRYSTGVESGPHAVLEVWHDGDRVRRDVVLIGTTETAHTEEFLSDGKFVRCVQVDNKPWQCVGAPAETANLQDPVAGAADKLKGRDVTQSTDTIAVHPVTCYTVAAPAGGKPSEFCLSDDDVPLRIDGGDGKPTTATNYDRTVDDSVFTYPATVAGA